MSLVGNLEDLGLGEILQIVSLSRKSGVLSLASRGREARIVFRSGQVIRAGSSTFQLNLGEVLIQKGVIPLTTLRQALAIQEGEGYRQLLGTILVERFGISADAIEKVVREQIENVVYSLFVWAEGTFEFELQEIAQGSDDIRLDPVQFMLQQGLNPQYLAMEGSRIADERRHRGEIDDDEDFFPHSEPEDEFDFAFNLVDEPVASEPQVPLPPAAEPERPLLVVDDDPATLEALAALLQDERGRVIALSKSEDALSRLESLYREGARPTLVIDMIMPRIDGTGILGGLELMETVRGSYPDLPLLGLTDFPNLAAERRAAAHHIPVLAKPPKSEIGADLDQFRDALLAALARVEAPQEGGDAREPDQEFLSGAEELHEISLGAGEPAPGVFEMVNLGDELRLELGEEPEAPQSPPPARESALLKGMLEELNDPALGGGIILLVLRFASQFMNRAVVLLVKRDEIQGLGQFGIEAEGDADSRVRDLQIPRGEPSFFTPAIGNQLPVKGRVESSRWNDYFLGQLGGGRPLESFAGPIVSEGKVVALLYGDNLPEQKAIGDTDSLEIFLSQAGIAMEKALLQRRLRETRREET